MPSAIREVQSLDRKGGLKAAFSRLIFRGQRIENHTFREYQPSLWVRGWIALTKGAKWFGGDDGGLVLLQEE